MFKKIILIIGMLFLILGLIFVPITKGVPIRRKLFIKDKNILVKKLPRGVAEVDEFGLPWQAGGIWVGTDEKPNITYNIKNHTIKIENENERKQFKNLVESFLK